MATEARAAGQVEEAGPTDDYQAVPKPRARVNPEARIAPTCMIWSIAIGLFIMACLILTWAIPMLGVLNVDLRR